MKLSDAWLADFFRARFFYLKTDQKKGDFYDKEIHKPVIYFR